MRKFRFSCMYCGHSFVEEYYTDSQAKISINSMFCPICKDENLKVMKEDRGDIFGYGNESKPDAYIKKEDNE